MSANFPPDSTAPRAARRRPHRPRRSFDWLEARVLLSAAPLAMPAELTPGATVTGVIAAGEPELFRIDATADELLVATVHAPGARTRLSLLNDKGGLLTQSDGVSTTNPDDLIVQHIPAGTSYLSLEATGGAGPFTLTTQQADAFAPGQPIGLGGMLSVTSMVSGDFNGDHHNDIAVALSGGSSGEIEVLLGRGDGTSSLQTIDPSTTSTVGALAVGDFNGDGRLDIAAGFSDDSDPKGSVAVFLGQGDGTFGSPISTTVGGGVASLAVGDFGGDGRLDIAAGFNNYGTGSGGIAVLSHFGGGGFAASTTCPTAAGVSSLAAGDFVGTGTPDLVVGFKELINGGGGFSVLHNQGDGTFAPPVFHPLAGSVESLAVGDFRGDGRPELAVGLFDAGTASSEISVFPGIGGGAFGTPSTYASPGSAVGLLAGDFYGNGKLDLATDTLGGVAILPGDGQGGFGPAVVSGVPGGGTGLLVAGDFNEDGKLDLATSSGAGVEVLAGQGDGSLLLDTRSISSSVFPFALGSVGVADDFNGDGRIDLAVAENDGLAILPGEGDGKFGAPIDVSLPGPVTSVVSGDFNGDGRRDLAVVFQDLQTGKKEVEVLLGNGDGTFAAQTPHVFAGNATSLASGDFNGDGRSDLVVGLNDGGAASGIAFLAGTGDGTFAEPTYYATPEPVLSLARGDFNGDGTTDVAADYNSLPNASPGGVAVFLGVKGGALSPSGVYPDPNASGLLVAGDFAGNGRIDLAVDSSRNLGIGTFGVIQILSEDGHGSFSYSPGVTIPGSVESLAAGDFSGNGRDDLVASYAFTAGGGFFGVPSFTVNGILLFPASVTGSFGQSEPLDSQGQVTASFLIPGAFTGDGRTDLVALDTTDNLALPFLNNDGTFSSPGDIAATVHSDPLVADLTGDGAGDVTVIDQSGEILWRRALPGRSVSYESPVVVNPGNPSRDIAIVSQGGRNLIASVDELDNAVTLYGFDGRMFRVVGRLTTGQLPAQVVAANLLGNGEFDLIVRNAGDGTISTFFGQAGGGFTAGPVLSVGPGSSDILAADLSGSGRDDIVVANQATGDIRIYPNRGGGSFGNPSRYQAGRGPYGEFADRAGSKDLTSHEGTSGLAVVTATPGGLPGLAAINPGSETLSILDGLGGGALADPRVLTSIAPDGSHRVSSIKGSIIRSADLRGNGISDLLVLGPGGLDVYLGDGEGGYSATPKHYDVGANPTGLTVATLDGEPSLLIGNTHGDVLILLGDGTGMLRPDGPKVDQRVTLAVADLKGNGQKDVIYANQGLNSVSVQYGGSGPLSQNAVPQQGLLAPGAVTVADLNGDGIPDLIVANSGSNNVLVYLGMGNGQFGPALNGGHGFFTGTDPVSVTVAHLTSSGLPDLVVADKGSNDVAILLGQLTAGGGLTFVSGPRLNLKTATEQGFGPVATAIVPSPSGGPASLAVSLSGSNQVFLLPGLSQGFFDDKPNDIVPINILGTDPGSLFVGNFTGHPGELDLVTINAGSNNLTFIPNFLNGGVATLIASGGIDPTAAFMGDFLGNGHEDLLVANTGDGRLALFLGGSNGLEPGGSMDFPNPTGLAFDSVTGNILNFYASSQGVNDAATLIAFNLGGVGFAPDLTGGSSSTQEVARLQALNGSVLALTATLLAVAVETPLVETASEVASSPGGSGGLPNQPIRRVDDEPVVEDVGEVADEENLEFVVPPPALSPLSRFIYRLDEAFDRVRLDALEHGLGPQSRAEGAAGPVQAIDAVLRDWPAAPPAGLARVGLVAAHLAPGVETPEGTGDEPAADRTPMGDTAGSTTIPDHSEVAGAAASIGLLALVRAPGEEPRASRRRCRRPPA